MHRQLSLSASPKQQQHQQPPPDGTGGGDAAKAMAAAEDESSASHSSSKASRGWSARDERAIHLVPLLTFLCFLLLFLCSHDPSPAGTHVTLVFSTERPPPSIHSLLMMASASMTDCLSFCFFLFFFFKICRASPEAAAARDLGTGG
jgi:hypothetical protein